MTRELRYNTRGVTLLEALITMLLLSLAMALVATLVQNYSRVTRKLSQKGQTQQAMLLLSKITSELEEATSIGTPAPGSLDTSTEVRMKKFAATPNRLALAFDSSTWDPDYVLDINYSVDHEKLKRETTYPTSPPTTVPSILVSNVSGFSCRRLNRHTLEVRLTIQESKILKSVASCAYRRSD